jgi:hypothetical protein
MKERKKERKKEIRNLLVAFRSGDVKDTSFVVKNSSGKVKTVWGIFYFYFYFYLRPLLDIVLKFPRHFFIFASMRNPQVKIVLCK